MQPALTQATMMDTPLTLNNLLERAGGLFGDVEVVSRRPDGSLHRYTYRDMYRRARQLAKALTQAGMQVGDRVATLMWNHSAHLEAYFGIPAAGGVLHTLNLRLFPQYIAYIANHAGARFLILDDVLLPLYQQFAGDVDFERVIVVPFGGDVPADMENYEDFLVGGSGAFDYPLLDEKAPCGMCYTSGTTGRPKGVVYSHRSSVLHALSMSLPDSLSISCQDSVLPVVPMFHANAWGLPYAAAMVGARQVLPGPHLDAENLLDLFAGEGVTLTGGVPTIWMGVLQALRASPKRWALTPGMRMLVGGSAVPPSLIQAFEKFDLTIMSAWGLTETSPLASVSQLRPEIRKRDASDQTRYRAKAGVSVPLVDIRIRNDEGTAAWDGETVGEIELRGPFITASYFQRPDADDRFSDGGWFRTGDIAYITPEGYISITDRDKDLIKSGGEWISSQELENEIMAHAAVAEAAVIAVPHERWMERPLALVVRQPGKEVSAADIRDHLKGKFVAWWLPDAVEFIETIPRTSTGKFQKLKLREQFSDWGRIENVTQPEGPDSNDQ